MESAEQRACNDLMLLMDSFKVGLFELAEEYGLTKMQMFVLYWIDKHHELAMGQIATMLHCDASNVTGIVDRLVANQFIIRHESARDRRTKTLKLTDKGVKAIATFKATMPAKLGCQKLTQAERTTLHNIAQKLSDNRQQLA